MKRYRKYLIAVGVVALWGIFSWAYLGVEDGSSGLSPLGWLHAVFFLPGGMLLQATQGSHGNTDLPLMAVFSLFVYAAAIVIVIKAATFLRRAPSGK